MPTDKVVMRGSDDGVSRSYIVAICAFFLTVFMAMTGYSVVQRYEMHTLERGLIDRLTLTRHSVVAEVDRFRYLPSVVAQDAQVWRLLYDPEPASVRDVNRYLQSVRDLSGVDELYVLDPQGVTLAASNWNQPDSFVGRDYSFRPYFSDALTTGQGRHYAVGVTTGKPGYFLSLRLGPADRPAGVVVVKVDMSRLEAAWVRAADRVGLADATGIVFLSGPKSWRYRPLNPLTQNEITLLNAERRYDGLAVETSSPLLTPQGTINGPDGTMRIARGYIEPDGWQVVVAAPLAPVRVAAATAAVILALLGGGVTGLGLIVWQRRQIIRIRLEQADVLEQRVAERTRALAREVQDRRLAEEELRRTHASLVHAARLAVLGRMSATIVHEVSQPLSALDATLAAAELHLSRGHTDRAGASLGSARALLRRMQDMVRTLRRFGARQKPAAPEPVDVASALAGAMEILSPRLRELDITVAPDLAADLAPVSGNAGQVQQVLTNLILNAAEATAGAGVHEALTVTAQAASGRMQISILDRGPGIPDEMREQVFEPFFTTRVTGEGLGLGLSIVRSILEGMGGRMAFRSRPGGGTETVLDLPVFGTAERML